MENSFENIHAYLKAKRKARNLTKNEKDTLYEVVINIKERSEKQKRRFILYYGLDKIKDYKEYTYKKISEIDRSSISAIRFSVIRVGATLSKMEESIIKK